MVYFQKKQRCVVCNHTIKKFKHNSLGFCSACSNLAQEIKKKHPIITREELITRTRTKIGMPTKLGANTLEA